jgi:hypothetical protein
MIWQKGGESPNPGGRPKGTGLLRKRFIADLMREWEVSGQDALARLADKSPGQFCQLVASVLPKEIDVNLLMPRLLALSPEELQHFRDSVAALPEPPLIEADKDG